MFRRWRELRRRRAVAKAQQSGDILHDPIEDDPQHAAAFAESDRLAELALEDVERGRGFCHQLWRVKQAILRDQFGIEWFTPAEINKGVIFD